jgi:hypothetical protein
MVEQNRNNIRSVVSMLDEHPSGSEALSDKTFPDNLSTEWLWKLPGLLDRLERLQNDVESFRPPIPLLVAAVKANRMLAFVSWKDRKTIMPSIKAIYHAENADAALQRLEAFEAEWGKRYPAIGQAWRRAWQHVVPFFAFAPEIRKMIYTTNAVEALNRSLRKIIKTRGSFPTDEAAMKLLYLAIKNAGVHWRRPIAWTAAMSQLAIQFGDRPVRRPFCSASDLTHGVRSLTPQPPQRPLLHKTSDTPIRRALGSARLHREHQPTAATVLP